MAVPSLAPQCEQTGCAMLYNDWTLDETVVRPIVVKCRFEVKSNEAEVVPSFATGIVEDDESPAGCNWVGEEVVGLAIDSVVGRDRRQVGVGLLKIEC